MRTMKLTLIYFPLLIVFAKCQQTVTNANLVTSRSHDDPEEDGTDVSSMINMTVAISTTEIPTTTMTPEMQAVKSWEEMEKSLKSTVEDIIKQALPFFLEKSSKLKISGRCQAHLLQLVFALQKLKPWAFYMLDALGKPLTGTLMGSVSSFGSYDECLDVMVNNERSGKYLFQGQYCSLELHLPLPPKPRYYRIQETLDAFANFSVEKDTILRDISKIAHLFYSIPFRLDLCMPSTCSKDDVEEIIRSFTSEYGIRSVVKRCEIKEEWSADNYEIGIFCAFGVILIIVILGSLLEMFYLCSGNSHQDYDEKRTVSKILLCFSIYSNSRKLFNTEVKEDRLLVIHGLKALTLMWMMFANVYFATNRLCFSTLRQMIKFPDIEIFQVLINFSLSVDNLLFSSGVIVAYMSLRSVEKFNQNFSIIPFLLKRIWRTLPSLMLLIGISMLIPMFGSGPLWKEVMNPHVENCKNNWWTNLLFINNFITKPDKTCFTDSVYFSVDIQLYIISLIVFIPLHIFRSNKWAMIFNFLLIIGSIISTSVLTHVYKLPPTMLFTYLDPEDLNDVKDKIFHKPYCHIGAYFIGIAMGWFLYKNKDAKMKMWQHMIGWPISLATSMAVLFGVYEWNRGNVPSDSVSSLYAGLHRSVWALTLAWFTAVCYYGQGGIFRKLFTWKAFVPLSRLTFVSFLIQYIVLLIICGFLRERIQPNHIIAFFLACGLYLISYLVAYACWILFDGPVQSLKKMFFDSQELETKHKVHFINDQYLNEKNTKKYDLYRINSDA
ncbi:nose resistant to fluoxetine protein 6-like [Centruroides sculpturatus]|uniref:nose resistant to fluoxetine protein 6-like n=1 Tax=Centruroides sculpturatus TaxID=218467 RepID=UPI000C6EE63F|nr:nose resistant to fluoxetine protein 6-like [Centruroides sculpturatus]